VTTQVFARRPVPTPHRADPGARFSLIPFDGFDFRRADALCSYCAQPIGMRTDLTMTASHRPSHTECVEMFAPDEIDLPR